MGEVARAIVKLANLTFLQACTARSQAFTRTLFGSYRAFITRDRRSRAIVSTALVFSSSRILSPQRSARRLPAHLLPSLAGGEPYGHARIPSLDGLLSSKAGQDSGYLLKK